MIFNDLLSNPDFGNPAFSARPYWNRLQQNPDNALASLDLGNALLNEYFHYRESISPEEENEYYDAAIAVYQHTLRITEAPSLKGDAHLGLGRVYTLKQQYREAMEHLQKTLEIAQNEILPGTNNALQMSTDAYVGIGVVLGQLCDNRASLDAFLKAVEANPEQPDIDLGNLESLLTDQNRLSDMIPIYQKVIEHQPNFFGNYANLARLLADQGNFAEAIANYRRSIELQPDSPYSYYHLGRILADQGNVGEAIANLRQAARFASGDPEIQAKIRDALQGLERP